MKVYNTSREDYLKAILRLRCSAGNVRPVDVANYLGYSRASVSNAVSSLKDEGYLERKGGTDLHLTEKGMRTAEKINERHRFFTRYLVSVGVDRRTAAADACRLEHAISDESFEKLKAAHGEML